MLQATQAIPLTEKEIIMSIKQVLYRASAKATGGREGRAVSSDGVLDVKLTTPKELGGAGAVEFFRRGQFDVQHAVGGDGTADRKSVV